MLRCAWLLAVLAVLQMTTRAEPAVNGVRPSNILGGAEQHASFSFVRPGLTQTAYAFNGPSSHQAFSSSIGDPNLAQRVLPSVAHALAYRNPGLGYTSIGPVTTAYASGPLPAQAVYQPQQQIDYQQQQQQALAYQQQLQQYQQYLQQGYSAGYAQQMQAQSIDATNQQSVQQAHLAQLLAARFAGIPQAQQVEAAVPEQIQLQQQQQVQQQEQQQTANLLGVAYSAAPSVAHVKVTGNGYKFDF